MLEHHSQNKQLQQNLIQKDICSKQRKHFHSIWTLKPYFISSLQNVSIEERYLMTKIYCPDLVSALRKNYRRIDESKLCQNKMENLETKKIHEKMVKQFIEALILISDFYYLDTIGFDHHLVDSPQKLFQILFYFYVKQQNQAIHCPILNQSNQIQRTIKQLFNANTKQQFAQILAKFLFTELLYNLKKEKKYFIDQKYRKKQFMLIWKNSNQQIRHRILYGGYYDIKQLIIDMLDTKCLTPRPQELQKQILELQKMQKNEFCKRILKSKLRKPSILFQDYHQRVFDIWKEQVQKKRKNKKYKNKKNNKQKRNKSLGIQSNQTNQTQTKELNHLNNLDFTSFISMKIQNDIISMSDQISEQANQYYERKVEAFNRLQSLLNHYFQIDISLFGSCACGLAIKNSDIDIAIDEKFLSYFEQFPDNKRVSVALDYLGSFFQNKSWIKNIKVVRKAAVPIINLTIDTSIAMIEGYMSQLDYIRVNSAASKGLIDVDLTIQTKSPEYGSPHLGIVSTKQICEWLQSIENLHQITIILKYYLTIKNLNDTYSGGLKTYSLIIMIIAYIWNQKTLTNTIEQLLQGLTKFYGYQFDQEKFGIDISNKSKVFYEKAKIEQNSAFLQIKDPLNGKIMTKSCYLFSEIKKLMRIIHNICFQKNKQDIQNYFLTTNMMTWKSLSIDQILQKCKNALPKNPFNQICNI